MRIHVKAHEYVPLQAGTESKPHPLAASTLKSVASTNTHNSSEGGGGGDACEVGEADEGDEVEGGFSGIRMESVKDIIAKARFAESFLRGGSGVDLGENLEELAQIVNNQECKQEDGVCGGGWLCMCTCVCGWVGMHAEYSKLQSSALVL